MKIAKAISITGPTAVGKTEIVRHLVGELPNTVKVITTTTRSPRSGEVEDVSYHFVTPDKFKTLIDNDKMLEWTIYNDNYYGIQLADFDSISEVGKIPMAAMDVPGALMMQEKNPQALVLFIAPDDLVVIKNRLLARGFSAADVERRMELTKRDLSQAEKFNRVVVNKDGQFDATLAEVVGIIQEWLA